MSARTWIGLDPSLAAFGFAAMMEASDVRHVALEWGTWKTKPDPAAKKKADSTAARILVLAREVSDFIDKHQPEIAFVEESLFLPQGGLVTATLLGRVRGMVDGVCAAKRVELVEFNPTRLKNAIAGSRGASKGDVGARMREIYPYIGEPDDNATDALALAHLGAAERFPLPDYGGFP